MDKKTNQEIKERLAYAIQAVINQQIAEKDPLETIETLERLMGEGFTEEEAYVLIGKAVGREVAELIAGGQTINMERYKAALEELPQPFAMPKIQKTELDDLEN